MNALFPRHLQTAVATVLLVTASAWAVPAAAQTAFPATLAGHAVLPALSLIPAPQDAPADLRVSGKFTTGQRVDKIGSVEGLSAGRPTGVSLPFKGQPVQGHSGIKRMADGSYWL
jgi:hypothetical protein